MTRFSRFTARLKPRAVLRNESGMAAVEFALISTMMFGLLSGAVDLTRAVIGQRDLHRFTAEVAQVLAACADESCVVLTINAINTRIQNVAPGIPKLQVGAAAISRKNNIINTDIGTMTYMPTDMNAVAMGTLANGDFGVAVLATSTVQPIILGFAEKWGFTVKNFRAHTVALRVRKDQT